MSQETPSNSKRLAKNTLLLYIRMLFTMAVSLYTSRVVLEVLGVDNYGIYNVVGGVVAMFTVLSGSLTSAISRFITFELGQGNKEKLKRVFCTSVNIQLAMALIVMMVAETVGVWFLNYKMKIPDGRLDAANWVLQCSILTFMINLVSVPYNACIIAHEKMSAFAYISVLEVSAKLAVVYLLIISPIDKLVAYAIMLALVAIVIRFVYGVYCKKHFEESIYYLIWDKSVFKEMLSFAGWNFFGNTAYMLNTQGVNMLINLFSGVAMNAARGIAVQVDNAVMGFINNFSIAIQPQITKSYAAGDYPQTIKLMNRGTKFSAYIMFFFMIPFVLEAETILSIWLKEVPEHCVIFVQVVMFASFCGMIGNYLYYGILATGKVRRYQLEVTVLGASVFPLTWVAYELGFHAAITYIIYGVVYASLNLIRINILKKLIGYQRRTFFFEAILPLLLVGILSLIPSLFIIAYFEPSFVRLMLTTVTTIVSTAVFAYLVGFTKSEKVFVNYRIKGILNKFR